ncbi:MAG TPA: DDE-type integrase/transposase/recombinase [bacterium]|nr:DDE-type integrase/transposase/recombinase [bacterium]
MESRRKTYPPEHKAAVLKALAIWTGSRRAFCELQGINRATLLAWQRSPYPTSARPLTTPTKYNMEQRRQAVEGFLRAGLSYAHFSKVMGMNDRCLMRWVAAYRRNGLKGLEDKRGRFRKGKPLASALLESVKLVRLEFPSFGLRKISAFLARFKGVKASPGLVRKALDQAKVPPLEPMARRWRNSPVIRHFERARPGELWQTDITSFLLTRNHQRVYLVAYMDDHSRYVVSWKLAMKQTGVFVQETLLEGVQRFGKPQELLSDQGRQYFAWRGKSEFQKLLVKQGIQHVVSRAHHPETLGKCERFWGTVGTEFWSRAQPQDLFEAQERLGHFINHYNHFRPHQGIDNAVPADRFFGAENQVRKALEAAWSENQLALALDKPARQPVFLVGQIGGQSLSLHGEAGKLVLQTSDGHRQEIAAADLGMPQVLFSPSEDKRGRGIDLSKVGHDFPDALAGFAGGGANPTGDPGSGPEQGAGPQDQTVQEAGQTQGGLPNGHPALADTGYLGSGADEGAPGCVPVGRPDPRALAGSTDPQGSGRQVEPAAPAGLAVEPASPHRHGGGTDGPAEAAGPGHSPSDGQTA